MVAYTELCLFAIEVMREMSFSVSDGSPGRCGGWYGSWTETVSLGDRLCVQSTKPIRSHGDGCFERFASWMKFPVAFASAVYFCLLHAWLKIALSVPVFLRCFLFSLLPRFDCLTRAITHIISLWSLRKSESLPECREKWRWKGRKARRNQLIESFRCLSFQISN